MALLRKLFLSSIAAAYGTLLHAGTITYNLAGVSTSAGTLTGAVALDSTNYRITSARLTFNDTDLGSPVFTTVASSAAYNGIGQDYISGPSSGPLNYGGQAALFFNTANAGSGSLSICTLAAICGTQGFERSLVEIYSSHGHISFDLTGGALTEAAEPAAGAAPTPEPSSLLLLGTGIFGVAGITLFTPFGISARRL